MVTTPILFLVFNRPELTKQVFEEIRRAKPQRLFIAADGPRSDHDEDAEKCERVRMIVSEIDWNCESQTLFREKNLGCEAAVSSAIDWFFDNVESGMILEDDCLPDQTFFRFCEELLERYKDERQVMMISGYNAASIWPAKASYIFSRYASIWGWATWKRAWRLYDRTMSSWADDGNRKTVRDRIGNHRQWKTKEWIYDRVLSGKKDSWDYAWDFSVLLSQGLTIVPSKNLIENLGFGKEASHTVGADKRAAIKRQSIGFPLVHNDQAAADDAYDAYFFKRIFGGESFIKRALKRLIR